MSNEKLYGPRQPCCKSRHGICNSFGTVKTVPLQIKK